MVMQNCGVGLSNPRSSRKGYMVTWTAFLGVFWTTIFYNGPSEESPKVHESPAKGHDGDLVYS